MKTHNILFVLLATTSWASATEYHVSTSGSDANSGAAQSPLRTIQAAADLAAPGDLVTVHQGTYRERVNPPRGGTSEDKRIVFQAAYGEDVAIKGSEIVKGWKRVQGDTWKVTLPNSFFGEFNPYADLIQGDWFKPEGRAHHTGAVYSGGHWLIEGAEREHVLMPIGQASEHYTPVRGDALPNTREASLWFAQVDDSNTTIWAQFQGVNPNETETEINVRQSVFYPEQPGVNYITVRGFTMEHAATPWAPPTAEQIGLIGTHWSKGWTIENNIIRYSVCTGVTLGKHGDEFDNTSQNSAEGYVETIKRAHAQGWSKARIGHHVVRDNHISHCEQAGVVGSMGPAFSLITGNTIHDIHVRRLFAGAEMAGIKFHGAVDTVISHNHIYRTTRGIWLDWMTQGTRVTCNLLHDNGPAEDLFVEVNHGPFLVDNNILLSRNGILVNSQGAAYVHNLIAGRVRVLVREKRLTPYLEEHTTKVAGLAPNRSGDERYYNNIFVGGGLAQYDPAVLPVFMTGNVFLNGAKPSKHELNPLMLSDIDPAIELVEQGDALHLAFTCEKAWTDQERKLVTTELLGKARTPNLPYVQHDGTPYRIDTDYFGEKRSEVAPTAGPFENPGSGEVEFRVWPR